MPAFHIAIDLERLIPPEAPFNREVFPHLVYAIERAAQEAQARWQAYASGKPLPNGRVIQPRSGTYLRSIQRRKLSDFGHEVYSDLVYADAIERGTGPRDMKRMLDTSFKVRVNKQGKRYLIIPFRHGIPGTVGFRSTMSADIHALAKEMEASRITGMSERASGTGAYDIHTRRPMTVPRRHYHWGGRLSAKMLREIGASEHEIRRMRGMVKMQHPTRGGSRDTQYLTFRTMSEDSPGWRTQGTPPKWPARTTAEEIRPIAERTFEEAVKQDVELYLGRSTR